ncbi:MAG TPA: TonB-dependent receptor [Panacibacter sp.]|nr:TonB-dependent receptor [Panacibacter sp.]
MKTIVLFFFSVLGVVISKGQVGKQKQSVKSDTVSNAHILQEVVVSASRISEKQLTAPVSISKLNNLQIQQTASPSFFDAVGSMKGVHMIEPSLGFKIINTRGFSNTTNVRFVQLVDNIDNQSPHIGAPIANALCPSDLDIDHVEIIQGVASALYGMNATNGLANFTTKDPFVTQGISILQQLGVNHINDPNNVSAQLYNETNFRWAKVVAKKWAFKINAGFIKGYDWIANNKTDLNPLANQTTNLLGADNPAYDPVNGYGNESSNRKTLTLGGKNYVVARTGYYEKQVTDYHLQNWKGDVSLYYKPNDKTIFSYTYRTAFLNNVYQRSNRFQLENYLLQQHILQYNSSLFQARAYINSENTGDSYNLRSMAENIDVSFKSSAQWYTDYTKGFNDAVAANNDVASAHHLARAFADNGRLQPGTDAFNEKLKQLQQVNNWDYGAALHVKANLLHTEASFDLGKLLHTKYSLQFGCDFRDYIIVPDGNYFINPTDSGHNLNYTSYGFFVRASQNFLHEKLQFSAALRASTYEYFNLKWSPRITAVYALAKTNIIRFSYQNGYRFPSIFEGFSNINSGGVKRVGGLKVMSNGIFENSWLKSSIDAFQAAVIKDVNTGGLTQAAAIDKNKALLQRNTYTYLQPEQMHSFELGYRSILLNNKFSIDADVYYNSYSNFIAQIEASIPNTQDESLIPSYLYDKTKQARYRLWTNSKTVVHNYGTEIELHYIVGNHYALWGNASYQALKKTDQNDGLEDGFNTPQWIANLGFTGTNIYKKLGFNITFKYQSSYYWQSFLINGNVPAVFNADCMLRYSFSKPSIDLKIGASNVLNHYYYSILGGPQIGGFYYTTLTYSFK